MLIYDVVEGLEHHYIALSNSFAVLFKVFQIIVNVN